MEKVNLVKRKPDAEDQRISRVYLTPGGRALQGDVEQTWHRLEEEIFSDFTLEERLLLRRFFLQMRENLMRVTRK
jgi:DNA-binding MarR family transcriptional regulator